jgi:two-component system LytT family sensor kinase
MRIKRFVDLYRDKQKMNIKIDKATIKFYLWAGVGFFILTFLSYIGKYGDQFFAWVFNNLWAVIYVVVINFILFERAVPWVLKKRQYAIENILLGGVVLFGFMLLYSFGSYIWRGIGIGLHVYTPLREFASTSKLLENQMAYSMGSVFLFGISRHVYNYLKLKQTEQQLRIEKQAAELNYLRSQTNPHFLFNTLNNIYSLARDKSDLAAESILRLSKILRFMLYETGGNFIAIEQELQIIQDYIDLEKLRYDESLRINFNHDIEDMKQALPPLLLMPLVENAFKHGVSETRKDPFIDIHLSINKRVLTFIVKNSTGSSVEPEIKENIGLSNLRRQLELLFTEYNLAVQPAGSIFTATLKINLASHV